MKEYLLTILIGYALGCFNTAYFISKAKGFDIRDTGSGNAGASNIKIALGWKYGILTALTDILKSAAAVYICSRLFPDNQIVPFLAGAMAVVGHIFPFYMNFKGGKGYASYFGMILAVNWKLALALAVLGVMITLISNYIALATLSTVVVTPAYYFFLHASIYIIVILLILAALMFYKHRINIQRIIRPEEIGLRKKKAEA